MDATCGGPATCAGRFSRITHRSRPPDSGGPELEQVVRRHDQPPLGAADGKASAMSGSQGAARRVASASVPRAARRAGPDRADASRSSVRPCGAALPRLPPVGLPFSPQSVEGGVGATDELEMVADDDGLREHRLDREPVGVVGIDRDNLDRRGIPVIHASARRASTSGSMACAPSPKFLS